MNILTSILSSKYFFKIPVSQTFPCQVDPHNYMYLAADLHLVKEMFQGPPEAEI